MHLTTVPLLWQQTIFTFITRFWRRLCKTRNTLKTIGEHSVGASSTLTRPWCAYVTFQITADPYFHVRNASEHGALNVIKVMSKHRDDLRVQGVGLQRMAGSLLEGNTSLRVIPL